MRGSVRSSPVQSTVQCVHSAAAACSADLVYLQAEARERTCREG